MLVVFFINTISLFKPKYGTSMDDDLDKSDGSHHLVFIFSSYKSENFLKIDTFPILIYALLYI